MRDRQGSGRNVRWAVCVAVVTAAVAGLAAVGESPSTLQRTVFFGAPNGSLGVSSAISGDVVVAGAWATGDLAPLGGAAHVCERSGGVWREAAELRPPSVVPFGFFGASVAVDGDTAVVGAWGYVNTDPIRDGAAFVYRRVEGVWQLEATLNGSQTGDGDAFGDCAIDGDTIVVGAPRDDSDAGEDVGSLYVFTRTGTSWTEQAHIVPTELGPFSGFGSRVALSGDSLFVGCPDTDTPRGAKAGTVRVYVRRDGVWSPSGELTAPDAKAGDLFGEAVAAEGDQLIVGGTGAVRDDGVRVGSAYVFRKKKSGWKMESRLDAPSDRVLNIEAPDTIGSAFGYTVAVGGDYAVVGAKGRDFTPDVFDAGSVFVYARTGSRWQFRGELCVDQPGPSQYAGHSVGVSGDDLIFGATYGMTTVENGAIHNLGAETIMTGLALWTARVDVRDLDFTLKYGAGAADRVTLAATVPPVGVPANLVGATVTVRLGGMAPRTVTLDVKGRGQSGDTTIAVKRGHAGKPANVSVTIKGDVSAELASLGMDGSASAKRVRVPIGGSIDLGAGPVTIEEAVRFTGTAGTAGSASLTGR